MEAHGGRIWAENEGPGLGARFTFTIPVVEEGASERRTSTVGRRQETGEAAPILVVDDDPLTLRHVRNALADAGYHPIVTADPGGGDPHCGGASSPPGPARHDVARVRWNRIDEGHHRSRQRAGDLPSRLTGAARWLPGLSRTEPPTTSSSPSRPPSWSPGSERLSGDLRSPSRLSRRSPTCWATWPSTTPNAWSPWAGRPVELTATEYRLLFELSVNAGRVLTHNQLLRKAWGPGKRGNLGALRTHLRRLRSKLGEDAANPTYFFAEPRVGYRMAKEEKQGEEL